MKVSFIALVVSLLWFSHCTTPQKEELKIGFTGDILLDRGVRQQLGRVGYKQFYATLEQQLDRYDFLVGNLECPLTEQPAPVHKKYVFRADTTNASYLKEVGFTHLIMANNHAYDQGRDGMETTAKVLNRARIKTVGFGQNKGSACEPILINQKGIEVALFASVTLALENWFPLEDQPCMCQEKGSAFVERIKQFKTENPDIRVVTNLHWGIEHMTEASPQQKRLARLLIDAGADAVIGHHPHVLQSIEYYKEKPIVYSLGNFIFDQQKSINCKTVLVELLITNDKIELKEHPYFIDNCIPYKEN